MTPERRNELARWRDAILVNSYGSKHAADRLAENGDVGDQVNALLELPDPSDDELRGCDFGGEPLDPRHPWWGFQGPSSMEIAARRRGTWPKPDNDR